MAVTYKKIASVTVGSGGAADIEFTSIPATYTDLLVKLSGRTTTGSFPNPTIQFNGDTASNYKWISVYSSGSGAGSSSSASDTGILFGNLDGSSQTASTFGNSELYIPNYAGSTQKSTSADIVSENDATQAYSSLYAGLWTGTAAITSIKINPGSGNFAQYSTATLYGISKS
jgi:hypothetical protein